ncbi:hypothetical protein DIPPA_19587 [Diplonema papillatum]|nr:hypothetical protein DIPPA_19587 [Diplonema papillatum]
MQGLLRACRSEWGRELPQGRSAAQRVPGARRQPPGRRLGKVATALLKGALRARRGERGGSPWPADGPGAPAPAPTPPRPASRTSGCTSRVVTPVPPVVSVVLRTHRLATAARAGDACDGVSSEEGSAASASQYDSETPRSHPDANLGKPSHPFELGRGDAAPAAPRAGWAPLATEGSLHYAASGGSRSPRRTETPAPTSRPRTASRRRKPHWGTPEPPPRTAPARRHRWRRASDPGFPVGVGAPLSDRQPVRYCSPAKELGLECHQLAARRARTGGRALDPFEEPPGAPEEVDEVTGNSDSARPQRAGGPAEGSPGAGFSRRAVPGGCNERHRGGCALDPFEERPGAPEEIDEVTGNSADSARPQRVGEPWWPRNPGRQTQSSRPSQPAAPPPPPQVDGSPGSVYLRRAVPGGCNGRHRARKRSGDPECSLPPDDGRGEVPMMLDRSLRGGGTAGTSAAAVRMPRSMAGRVAAFAVDAGAKAADAARRRRELAAAVKQCRHENQAGRAARLALAYARNQLPPGAAPPPECDATGSARQARFEENAAVKFALAGNPDRAPHPHPHAHPLLSSTRDSASREADSGAARLPLAVAMRLPVLRAKAELARQAVRLRARVLRGGVARRAFRAWAAALDEAWVNPKGRWLQGKKDAAKGEAASAALKGWTALVAARACFQGWRAVAKEQAAQDEAAVAAHVSRRRTPGDLESTATLASKSRGGRKITLCEHPRGSESTGTLASKSQGGRKITLREQLLLSWTFGALASACLPEHARRSIAAALAFDGAKVHGRLFRRWRQRYLLATAARRYTENALRTGFAKWRAEARLRRWEPGALDAARRDLLKAKRQQAWGRWRKVFLDAVALQAGGVLAWDDRGAKNRRAESTARLAAHLWLPSRSDASSACMEPPLTLVRAAAVTFTRWRWFSVKRKRFTAFMEAAESHHRRSQVRLQFSYWKAAVSNKKRSSIASSHDQAPSLSLSHYTTPHSPATHFVTADDLLRTGQRLNAAFWHRPRGQVPSSLPLPPSPAVSARQLVIEKKSVAFSVFHACLQFIRAHARLHELLKSLPTRGAAWTGEDYDDGEIGAAGSGVNYFEQALELGRTPAAVRVAAAVDRREREASEVRSTERAAAEAAAAGFAKQLKAAGVGTVWARVTARLLRAKGQLGASCEFFSRKRRGRAADEAEQPEEDGRAAISFWLPLAAVRSCCGTGKAAEANSSGPSRMRSIRPSGCSPVLMNTVNQAAALLVA